MLYQHRKRRDVMVATAALHLAPLPAITAGLPTIFRNLALLAAGSLLWVLALEWFMLPMNILSGGLLGIAMICGHYLPHTEVAWLNLLLNLPLFWLGWRYLGRAFSLYSLFGILVFSALAAAVNLPPAVELHPVWACLGAGLLSGGGSALILTSAGTAGGLDILVVYLRNRIHWPSGRLFLTLNAAILLAGGGLMGLETLVYSLFFLTISSHTIDALVRRFASAPASP
jgi:uncharacterized membrane-anchored protein YitT (DUF2179 family)